jgi:osmotically-inducible protein OsmY
MEIRTLGRTAAGLVLVLGLGACGESSDEERLTKAEELLTEVRDRVRDAREKILGKEQNVETARAELEQAREALREAELGLAEAEAKVDLTATDALLFRGIQRKLLEDDRLNRLAVRADVNKGVVTLRGVVSDPEAREAALEIARGFPGVASVENELELTPVGSPGP